MGSEGRKALDDMAHDVLMKLLEKVENPEALAKGNAGKVLAFIAYDIAKAMKAEGDRHVA